MNIKRALPGILTGISVITSIAAVVMAANDTPRALEILDDHRLEVDPTGETDLTVQEKVVDYAKGYWRTGALLAVSVACNIASCVISHSNYKALAASAAAISAAYSRHKDKVKELIGEEKAKLIEKQVHKEVSNDEFMTKKIWFQEAVSGEFFQSTWKDVYEAEYEANKRLNLEGYVTIGELFPIHKNSPKVSV